MARLNCAERRRLWPRRPAVALGLLALACGARGAPDPSPSPAPVASPVFEFSTDLLAGGAGAKVDLSRFKLGNPQLAGTYRADVYVNGRWLQRRDIRLAGAPAEACIDADLLRLLGLAPDALSPAGLILLRGTPEASNAECRSLETLTRDARTVFDAGELRMDITIPQASLARLAKGYVAPESWDHGVTAGLLGYNLNAYRATGENAAGNSFFLGLNGGINVGRWRLRHSGNFNHTAYGGSRYTELGTFVSTDLPDWQANLSLGDAYTNGHLFPSAKLRGVNLTSDERMLPDSLRGYAPVIRGVANSSAKVEIRQNNTVLYSTSVPPGPFEIDDLYPTGYGGDLQVIVTEADGSQRISTVPFSSLPQLLRAGALKYGVHAGSLLGYQHSYALIQGTIQRGLTNDFTLSAGLQLAQRYGAVLGGGAWNTPLGAFQANLTGARFERATGERHHGWSFDASWAKVIPATSTNLNFAAYRYSSGGFYSLDEAARVQDYDNSLYRGQLPLQRIRNRAVLSINQTLAPGLTLNLGANTQDYWDRTGRESSYQLGLYKQFGTVQLALNAVKTRNPVDGSAQRLYTASLILPLGGPTSTRSNLTGSFTHDSVTGNSQQAGFFGSAGERGELSYGLSYQRAPDGRTLAANGSYRGKYATLGATVSSGRGVSQQSFTASGGIVAADGHVVFAPYLGETVGLLHVSGAEGLRVASNQASELDSDGYTLLPYLSPYAANAVELDLSRAPLSARFDGTGAVVAPHAGAVVLLNFKRLPGYTLMLRARKADGGALPFGASVYDTRGMLVGSVGQAGRIEAASDGLKGSLRVAWGEDAGATCLIRYDLPRPPGGVDVVVRADVACEPFTASAGLAGQDSPAGNTDVQTPRTRTAVLLHVSDAAGQPLPDGTQVSLASSPDRIGVVARGRVMLRIAATEPSTAPLLARWSSTSGDQRSCALDLQVDSTSTGQPMTARCAVEVAKATTTDRGP